MTEDGAKLRRRAHLVVDREHFVRKQARQGFPDRNRPQPDDAVESAEGRGLYEVRRCAAGRHSDNRLYHDDGEHEPRDDSWPAVPAFIAPRAQREGRPEADPDEDVVAELPACVEQERWAEDVAQESRAD